MQSKGAVSALAFVVFVIYYFSNPHPYSYFDYTFQVSNALLNGGIGVEPRPWLNELIPIDGSYYSAFPLGSVLTVIPFAILHHLGIVADFPARFIAAAIAACAAAACFVLSERYPLSRISRVILALWLVLGTWMWCDLTFAGAWQIALGFGLLGQLLTFYFIFQRPRPFLAGLCFALAFGNRTEILIVAPIIAYLIFRQSENDPWRAVGKYLVAPLVLIALTLGYNWIRFHSIWDFGYSRIPGVLNEPAYLHGIWSLYAIPLNMKKMLLEGWKALDHYPYLVPSGFGGSIFLSSPFLFLMFSNKARDRRLVLLSWIAVFVLTLSLWVHGDPGGWQFSYRYAMDFLPWMFLILLESCPARLSAAQATLFGASVLINAYATYLFYWTSYVTP
jgi:hypothetical protein